MTTKTIELARKLAELAKRGVDGEKINAEKALQRIMEKYNLTFEDIEEDKKHACYFKFENLGMRRLLIQTIYSVIGDDYQCYRYGKNQLYLYATASQQIEIEMKWEAYRRSYKKQLKIFYDAFINKNQIFHESASGRDPETMTQADWDEYYRIQDMMKGIEKTKINKALKSA